MKSFIIKNEENDRVKVDLVRYFRFKNDEFLIYSKNEVDEKNYMKLYLVRIMEELGEPIVQIIKNESDWANMQTIVKKVLKEIKSDKRTLLLDLDYKKIEGVKVINPRYFKLDVKLVDVLSSNYLNDNDEQSIEVKDNIKEIDENTSKVDYKSLYYAVKKENESSSNLINELMDKISQYQEKIEELEN